MSVTSDLSCGRITSLWERFPTIWSRLARLGKSLAHERVLSRSTRAAPSGVALVHANHIQFAAEGRIAADLLERGRSFLKGARRRIVAFQNGPDVAPYWLSACDVAAPPRDDGPSQIQRSGAVQKKKGAPRESRLWNVPEP
eukprot:1695100-Pyramimonas_sp.AAC.1